MRICLSVGAYPTPEHPFAAFISSLAEEFSRFGHQVFVIAPQSITKILIPFDNADDLEDVAAEVKDKLKITPVKKVSDVLKLLLG